MESRFKREERTRLKKREMSRACQAAARHTDMEEAVKVGIENEGKVRKP